MNPHRSFAHFVFICAVSGLGSCACGHAQPGKETAPPELKWAFELSGESPAFRQPCARATLATLPATLILTVSENRNPDQTRVGVAVSFEIVEENLAPESVPIHTLYFFPAEQTGNFGIRLKEQAEEVLRRLGSRPNAQVFLVFSLRSLEEKGLPEALRLKLQTSGGK